MSGVVPQVCVLFGPSAAGGAYIPAFCDVVIMRDGNASMYLGSPRMAEMVIGEKVTLEEMGGARMHTGQSGCGHMLVKTDEEGVDLAKRYLSYFPTNWEGEPPTAQPAEPASDVEIRDLIPADEKQPVASKALIDGWQKDNPKAKLGSFGPPTYLAVEVALNAIKKTCDAGKGQIKNRRDIIKNVKKINLKTSILGGPFRFSTKSNDPLNAKFYIFQIQSNGSYKLVG